jgi:hypothetical protein
MSDQSNAVEATSVALAVRLSGEEGRSCAPALKAKGGRLRPIVVVDAEGKPVRNATAADLMEGLADKANVVLVAEGKRPLFVACVDCGKRVRVPKSAYRLPSRCDTHKAARRREAQRKRREANPEKAREAQRKYHEANPEYRRKWLAANRESARAGARERYMANLEKERARVREASRRRRNAAKAAAK